MKTIVGWLRRHIGWRDMIAAGIISVAALSWIKWGNGEMVINRILHENRGGVYGALVSLFGALLGFIITAASIVLGYTDSERLKIVRESKHFHQIGTAFVVSIRCLAFATVASLGALLGDKDSSPQLLLTDFCMVASIFAGASIVRTIWVLENILRIATKRQNTDPVPTTFSSQVFGNR